jgi:cell division transport system permease protein
MSKSPFKSAGGSLTASISTVVGITLVLVMLGYLSLILLSAKKLSDHFKENIQVQVFMKEDVNEGEIIGLQKWLEKQSFTSSATYVTREQAAAEMEEELGEDFVDFLGFYPIPSSLDLRLSPEYASLDSLNNIESSILERPFVREVIYQKALIRNINRNVNTISLYLLVFSALLLVIAIALINNTIRLAIFSKRFLIKSMQLVGATRRFIQRPFVLKGIGYGIFSGLLAFALIVSTIYVFREQIPFLKSIDDLTVFAELFAIVFILGIVISWISTKLAVRRYIRLRQDQLY